MCKLDLETQRKKCRPGPGPGARQPLLGLLVGAWALSLTCCHQLTCRSLCSLGLSIPVCAMGQMCSWVLGALTFPPWPRGLDNLGLGSFLCSCLALRPWTSHSPPLGLFPLWDMGLLGPSLKGWVRVSVCSHGPVSSGPGLQWACSEDWVIGCSLEMAKGIKLSI